MSLLRDDAYSAVCYVFLQDVFAKIDFFPCLASVKVILSENGGVQIFQTLPFLGVVYVLAPCYLLAILNTGNVRVVWYVVKCPELIYATLKSIGSVLR